GDQRPGLPGDERRHGGLPGRGQRARVVEGAPGQGFPGVAAGGRGEGLFLQQGRQGHGRRGRPGVQGGREGRTGRGNERLPGRRRRGGGYSAHGQLTPVGGQGRRQRLGEPVQRQGPGGLGAARREGEVPRRGRADRGQLGAGHAQFVPVYEKGLRRLHPG